MWGPAYFTIKMKALAERCGFTNPTRCTGQGKRSEGISRMVNSKEGIPLVETMRASRHDDVSAHLGYAEPDEEAHSKRYRALASKTVVHGPKVEEVVEKKMVVHEPMIEKKVTTDSDEQKFTAEEWMARQGGGRVQLNMGSSGMMMQPHLAYNPLVLGVHNGMAMQNGTMGMMAMQNDVIGMQNAMMGYNNGMMGIQGGDQMMGMVQNLLGEVKALKDQLDTTRTKSTE